MTSIIFKLPLGKYINYFFVPFRNYRPNPEFAGKSDDFILEYGVHDTFDALSPMYDIPLGVRDMNRIADANLDRPFEIEKWPTITMLRTRVDRDAEADGPAAAPVESAVG